MKRLLALLLALLPLAAQAQSPQQGFDALAQAIREDKPDAGKAHVTADSAPLYDRFVSYGLFPCLPKDAAFISEQSAGGSSVVRASLTAPSGAKQIANLTFSKEGEQWKFNLPASLQRGLGERWDTKVHNAEQLYLLLRQQLGDKLTCAAIQDIVKG